MSLRRSNVIFAWSPALSLLSVPAKRGCKNLYTRIGTTPGGERRPECSQRQTVRARCGRGQLRQRSNVRAQNERVSLISIRRRRRSNVHNNGAVGTAVCSRRTKLQEGAPRRRVRTLNGLSKASEGERTRVVDNLVSEKPAGVDESPPKRTRTWKVPLCTVEGCTKKGLGVSHLCKAHGGGARCMVDGCLTGVASQGLCKVHGGGRRCAVEGCLSAAANGCTRCILHGGGQRCVVDGCTNSAVREKKCRSHCGKKPCEAEGCTALTRNKYCAQHHVVDLKDQCIIEGCSTRAETQGNTELCRRHGGGRRCQHQGCTTAAMRATDFCTRHGGGSRCSMEGCTRAIQGKKFADGRAFCMAHGGGPECAREGCTSLLRVARKGKFCLECRSC